MSRYVVTEIDGYLRMANGKRVAKSLPGLSVHVIDTLAAHRIVSTWRSEDNLVVGRRREAIDAGMRLSATMRAAELNAEHDASL